VVVDSVGAARASGTSRYPRTLPSAAPTAAVVSGGVAGRKGGSELSEPTPRAVYALGRNLYFTGFSDRRHYEKRQRRQTTFLSLILARKHSDTL
jgi:hypothetical protein